MYIYLGKPVSLSKLKKPIQMCIVAVYTAIRKKAKHMQCTVILLAIFYSLQQRRILKKGSILNFLRDSGKLLINNAACSHIQMSHFRISHLSFRQSNRHTTCITLYKRTLCHQLVHNRGLGFCHGIVLLLLIQSISVQNH